MQSDCIRLRVPAALMKAAKVKAAESGLSLSLWARTLIEDATGVKADARVGGFAHMSAATLSKVARAGVKARAGKNKK